MQGLTTDTTMTTACNCIGPQRGEPVCPCMMRGVRIVDGRYLRITDLGPAPQRSGWMGVRPVPADEVPKV